jgi:hypothetical protein
MDSTGTDTRTCAFCEGRRGNPFWISWESNKDEVLLKGDFCSWSCYNRAFDNAWDEAANGYPHELMVDLGGEA